MSIKKLEGIELVNESRPYIDCLYSVLTASSGFIGPKYMLSGMTGFAFIFTAHRDAIIASTEMYELKTAAWNALNILGYYSETYDGLKDDVTFPLYQRKAVIRIRESVDRGMAVIVWAPDIMDFAVIYGYDDEDGVFYFKDRFGRNEGILLYSNLGKVQAAYWLCHIIGDRVEKDIKDIYIDSLGYAVDYWEIPYANEIEMRKEVASGRKAYEYLIDAMSRDTFNELGAGKIIYYNIISKNETCLYMKNACEEFPELYPAYLKYYELNEIYKDIKKLLPPYPVPGIKFKFERKNNLPGIIENLHKASSTEDEAVNILKQFLQENLSNRYIDLFDVKKFR
jgi:hypothetical protein